MNATRPQSEEPENAELTPEQRREGERNLARLLVIAKRQGVPAAMEEFDRVLAEKKRAKAQNSPAAG